MEALERTANPFGLFTTMSAARAVYPKKKHESLRRAQLARPTFVVLLYLRNS